MARSSQTQKSPNDSRGAVAQTVSPVYECDVLSKQRWQHELQRVRGEAGATVNPRTGFPRVVYEIEVD